MSSYARLSLGDLPLEATKDDIDPGLMSIFRSSDKSAERIDRRQRQRLAQYVDDVDEYDESNPFTTVTYSCTAAVAADRLDLKGFTYEVARTTFENELKSDIARYEGYVDVRSPHLAEALEEDLRVLRALTFSDWLQAFTRIKEDHLTRETLNELSGSDSQLSLLRYMFDNLRGAYGFPGDDRRHIVRVASALALPHELITYDLSEFVWEVPANELVIISERLINENFLLGQRAIVLTEGNADRRALERSLHLLYPHLADYFHFFDFGGRRIGGGVGELANLVRAFAAADVRHRILALFDNDTAARAAVSNLDLDSLPSNIAVRHYPSLPLASNYPTLGPSGTAQMDVNGLAGSIELYLGEDVLRDDEGVLSPVQWTGYNRGINAYQGQLLDKQRILDRFEARLACCEERSDAINDYDWDGIRAIIDTMRTAFHRTDTQAILSGEIYE